jgi:hypothetical protein
MIGRSIEKKFNYPKKWYPYTTSLKEDTHFSIFVKSTFQEKIQYLFNEYGFEVASAHSSCDNLYDKIRV